MKSIEKWVVAATCVVLVVVFSNFFYRITALKHLDSVFLFESSLSVLESGQPTSRTVASWPDALKTLKVPVETLCQSDLEMKKPLAYNVLDNHAYTALYPISLLTAFAGPELTFAFLNALAHVLLLIIPFVFLRKQGGQGLPSLAFVLCVALYPAWSYSAVGDYYLDRLYMPFALLSLYFMHAIVCRDEEETVRRLLAGFVASTIVAALFTERAAIMMMGEIVFFLLFFPQVRKSTEIRNSMLALLMLLGAYLFFYFRFVFEGIEGGGGLLDNAMVILHDPLQRLQAPGLVPFMLVNLLFMGIFAPFSGFRYFALGIAVMIPSFLITVGGAELNGWSTHYHAMYLPFLIFVASIGYLRLINRFNAGIWHAALPLIVGVYVLLVAGYLNPYTGKFEKSFLASVKSGVLGTISRYYADPQHSYERFAAGLLRSLDALIPQGSRVSAIEGVMPVLYRSRSLSMYPIDMDSADYLVISGAASDGQVTSVSGATSYLGQMQMEALNRCLSQRMIGKGFVLFKDMPSIGVLVFKRIQGN
ncbi:hypothetical protein [Candidatus Nitrotoga sp. 1052]|uniref:hypothetical protein n=1 Tax=Candidatus Nitrotoga sp. 1052 TaxID=2886964 RepID=UPI001EF43838|nr:hypothetical protein [Candidatus Nitrotoga sp. 1052]CAH1077436.1 conserved membrane hypothetical protein [Candidatus Nitrotoga sp. 1052]